MFPLPNGGTVRLAVQGRWDGAVDIVNVYSLNNIGATVDTAEECIADMLEWTIDLLTILKALYNVVMVWDTIKISDHHGTYSSGDYPLTSPIAGTLTSEVGVSGVALLSYMNTTYPRRQARKYWGPLDSSLVSATTGNFTAGAQAIALDAVVQLMDDYAATNSTWRYGVYSTTQTPAFLAPWAAFIPVLPAYQRRRRRGVGS